MKLTKWLESRRKRMLVRKLIEMGREVSKKLQHMAQLSNQNPSHPIVSNLLLNPKPKPTIKILSKSNKVKPQRPLQIRSCRQKT